MNLVAIIYHVQFILVIFLGAYAHTAERTWECNTDVRSDSCDDHLVDDIAKQLVHGPVGKHLKVIFGGGRYNFFDKTEKDAEGSIMYREALSHLIHVQYFLFSWWF